MELELFFRRVIQVLTTTAVSWSGLGCAPAAPAPEAGSTGDDPPTTGVVGGSSEGSSSGAEPEGSSGAEPEGSSSTGEVFDPELDAIANLRRDLAFSYECLDLRKDARTPGDIGSAVIVDLPPSNMAMPGEETAVRTYDLALDGELAQLRAWTGVSEPVDLDCEQEPTEGTPFRAIAGTIRARYEVVDPGCIFTCDRLSVEADDLVLERESDGATVYVEKLYLPPWADPMPPEGCGWCG